jgi:hypothetical protein
MRAEMKVPKPLPEPTRSDDRPHNPFATLLALLGFMSVATAQVSATPLDGARLVSLQVQGVAETS